MQKFRFVSALLSAVLGVACIAAPVPQTRDSFAVNELTAHAEGELYTTPDGYRYKINTSNRTASFIGYTKYEEELIVPPTITAVINNKYELECTVTNFDIRSLSGVGDEFHHGQISQIKKITIPGTIKNIKAFLLEDFYTDGWYSLEEIVLEEGVETIDSFAFDVKHLTKVTLPSTIIDINQLAFPDNFVQSGVLYGYSGTIAESYAKYKGIPFVPLADAPETDTTTSTTTTTAATTTTATTTTTSTSTEIVVTPSLPDLVISAAEITLDEGEQYTITANQSDLIYKSNNTDVAVVSKKGVVTALSEGTAIITVINADGDAVTLRVTVTSAQQPTDTSTTTSTTKATVASTTTTTTTVTTTTDDPYEEYLLGDCNYDGRFNLIDLVYLQKWLLAEPGIELYNWKAADYDRNGKLDVFDIALMKRALLKQIYGG